MSRFLGLAKVLITQEHHVHTATNDVWVAMLPPEKSDRILRIIADVVGHVAARR